MKFGQGTYVFIPDDEDVYIAAKVEAAFEAGSAGAVKLVEGGRRVKLSGSDTKHCKVMNAQSLEELEDMVNLKQLDEASILENLRKRFFQDNIYTNIGSILVSVNPFKVLPIYSPEIVDEYIHKGARNLPPHIFGVADNAFRSLVGFGKSQSCIISGESGAGKTEATKLFLQYIGERSGSGGKSATLQHQILEANPLLEAFGNAKTVRNDNSSRFGKLIQVSMDTSKGQFNGGSITSYLLEKSRLVQQPEDERNYHVFYQLCAAASMDPELNAKYDLMDADQYYYLNQSTKDAATVVPGMNDAHEWDNTVAAMETLGITDSHRDQIVRTLAGILHLGNIRFEGSEEKSNVQNKDMLARAADQLGTAPDVLEKALCMRNRGNARESVYSNQGVKQAGDSRDALAKAIYSLLFDWIIARVNDCLGAKKPDANTSIIGVLDIFGFESFVHNSFEQLCINYCNEKLQGHFNEHIFKLEQEEYKKEGVDVSKIDFVDNSAVLDAIEKKNIGLFALLTEENRLPRGSDSGFLSKALQQAGNGVLEKPDQKAMRSNKEGARHAFVVVHYAGPVAYDCRGFLVKNKDLLLADLAAVGTKSSFKFVANLFSGKSSGGKRGAADPNKKTIGTQFKEQLGNLMKTLNSTEPHYVRCIKSNSRKKGGIFTAPMVLDQLKYAGLLEVCRIRATGYPVRREFAEFVQRYRTLEPKSADSHKSLAKALEKKGILAKDQFQIGKSKMFFRTEQFDDLESAREHTVSKQAVIMQKIARGFVARKRFKKYKTFFKSLAKAVKERKVDKLEKVLLDAGVLPYNGRFNEKVQDAKKLLDKLHEEQRVVEMLEDAMAASDLNGLQTALKAAADIGMSKSLDVVKRAEKSVTTIEKQKSTRDALRKAVEKRDAKALAAALKTASSLGMQKTSEYKDAAALSAKMEEESATLSKLEKAVKKKDVSAIKSLLSVVAELGLENHKLVQQAQGVAKAEAKRSAAADEKVKKVREKLVKAIDERDLHSLETLCLQAIELGLKDSAVEEANRLRTELQGKADVVSNLTAEMKALEIKSKSHDGITEADIKPLSQAIQRASDDGIASSEEEMQEAITFEERMHKQVKVQKEVDKALATKSDDQMKKVVPKIMEVGLETGSAKKVLLQVRANQQNKSKAEREAAIKQRLENRKQLKEATADDKLKESMRRLVTTSSEEHRQRIQDASDNSRYNWNKFYKIRSDEDFTEYTHADSKEQYAGYKLCCQGKVIPKSLLDLDEDLSKTAVQNFKAILQYAGDLSNSFPSAMAGYVLVRGQETPELADEIYCQLMKQLTNNKKPLSEDRTWGLLCMCTKTFPPSAEFEPYLLNFLVNRRADPGLKGNYSRLCIVQLDATLQCGASTFLPDMEAIDAYSARPPILAEVALMTGETLSIPVSPENDVGYVLEIANKSAGVKEKDAQLYSIFVIDEKQRTEVDLRTRLIRFYRKYNPSKLPYVDHFALTWQGNEAALFETLKKKYGPEPGDEEDEDKIELVSKPPKKHLLRLPVTVAKHAVKALGLAGESSAPPPSPQVPWSLPWWSYLGDVYIRMIKQNRVPVFTHKRILIFPNEKMTEELFNQVREEVREGDLPINQDKSMAKLTAIDLAIQNEGKKMGKGKSLQDAIVEVLPLEALRKSPPSEWETLVKSANSDLPRSLPKLKQLYFDTVKGSEFFGFSFYYAQDNNSDQTVVIGINVDGVNILDAKREKVLGQFEFKKIAKFGASGTYFWLLVVEKGVSTQYHYKSCTPWSIYSSVYSITHVSAERMK